MYVSVCKTWPWLLPDAPCSLLCGGELMGLEINNIICPSLINFGQE